MIRFSFLAILLCVLQVCIEASPAKQARQAAPPAVCTDQNFGWPGFVRGSNPWGAVLNPAQSATLSSELSSACASYTPTSSSGSPRATTSAAPSSSTLPSSSRLTSATSSVSSSSPSVSTSRALSSTSISSFVSSPSTSSASTSRASSSSTSIISSSNTSSARTSTSAVIPATSTTSVAAPATTSRASSSSSSAITPISSSSPAAASPSSTSTSNNVATTQGAASSSDISSYLSAHNDFRAQHGAAPLTWNNTLSAAAQSWANGCQFKHSGGTLGPFGENLAAGTGGYTIQKAVNSWTSEASQYDPNNPKASHFTQVVWKGSTQLGCAVAVCNGIFPASYGPANYYVCEYYPAGNVIGRFPQNVQP